MAKEFLFGVMVRHMKEIGKMANKKGKELSRWRMVISMKEIGRTGHNKGKEFLFGRMEIITKENFKMV